MEILKDLTVYLDESEYKGGGGDITKLAEFFTNLKDYRINSYDIKEGSNEYCAINYSFVEPIPEFLKNVANNDDLKETFFLIYDGYKTKDIDKDLDDDENLPALLAQYNTKPLTEEVIRGFINGHYILAKTLMKKLRQFNLVLKEETLSRILDESVNLNGNARVKADDAHGIYETISGKINDLNSKVNGNAEANHQNAVPAPEE